VEIAGATDRIFTKTNSILADSGLYTYEVTNSVITELTLKSHISGEGITVVISDTINPIFDKVDFVSNNSNTSYAKV